jgi:hypothetical protein
MDSSTTENDTSLQIPTVVFSMISHLKNNTYRVEFMKELDSLFTDDALFIGKVILPVGNTETIINPVTKRDFSFIINRTCKGINKLNIQNKFLIDKE